jgi:hypothetical protein
MAIKALGKEVGRDIKVLDGIESFLSAINPDV